MTRHHLACYALTASAALLAGVLLVQLVQQGAVGSRAEASMVIAEPSFTVMTARTRANEDSLFALDNRQGTLMVYTLGARGELQIATVVDIDAIFGEAFPPGLDEFDADDGDEPVQTPGIRQPMIPED